MPDAQSTGAEFEIAAELIEGLSFSFAGSYVDAELDSTVTSTSGGVTSVISGIESGNRLPTVPRYQFAATLDYAQPLADGMEAFATATYQFVGSRFTQIGDQDPAFGTVNLTAINNGGAVIGGPLTATTFNFDPKLDSYDIANLRFGVRQDSWEVAIFVNNVFDENAQLGLDQERGSLARVGYLVNQPRTFGITTTIDF